MDVESAGPGLHSREGYYNSFDTSQELSFLAKDRLEDTKEGSQLALFLKRTVVAFAESAGKVHEVANSLLCITDSVELMECTEIDTEDKRMIIQCSRQAILEFEHNVMPIYSRLQAELQALQQHTTKVYNRIFNICLNSVFEEPIISRQYLEELTKSRRLMNQPANKTLELCDKIYQTAYQNQPMARSERHDERPRLDFTITPDMHNLLDLIKVEPDTLMADFHNYLSNLKLRYPEEPLDDELESRSSSKQTENMQEDKKEEKAEIDDQDSAGSVDGGSDTQVDDETTSVFHQDPMTHNFSQGQDPQGILQLVEQNLRKQELVGNNKVQIAVKKPSNSNKTEGSVSAYKSRDINNAMREYFTNEAEDLKYQNRESSDLKKYFDFVKDKITGLSSMAISMTKVHHGEFVLKKKFSDKPLPGQQPPPLEPKDAVQNAETRSSDEKLRGLGDFKILDVSVHAGDMLKKEFPYPVLYGYVLSILRIEKPHMPISHKLGLFKLNKGQDKKSKSRNIKLACSLQYTYDIVIDESRNLPCAILSQQKGKYIFQAPTKDGFSDIKHMSIALEEKKLKFTDDHSLKLKLSDEAEKQVLRMSQDGSWSSILTDDHKFTITQESSDDSRRVKYSSYNELKKQFQPGEKIADYYLEPIHHETYQPDAPLLVVVVLSTFQYIYLVRVFPKLSDPGAFEFDVAGKFSSKLKNEEEYEDHKINGIGIDYSKDIIFVVSNFKYESANKFTNILTNIYTLRKDEEKRLIQTGVIKKPAEETENQTTGLSHPEDAEGRIVMLRAFQVQGDLKSKRKDQSKTSPIIGSYQSPLLWPGFCVKGASANLSMLFTNQDVGSPIDIVIFTIKGFYNVFAAEYSKGVKMGQFLDQEDMEPQGVGIDLDYMNVFYDVDSPIKRLMVGPEKHLRANILLISDKKVGFFDFREKKLRSHRNHSTTG